jgi:hypothetical protein
VDRHLSSVCVWWGKHHFILACLSTIALLAGYVALADTVAPKIPDTPAGSTLGLWLDAFNSGDSRAIETFDKTYAAWVPLQWITRLRAQTGGYDLLRIELSRERDVIFRVKEKAGSNEAIGRIQVGATKSPLVTELGLFPIPPGSRFEEITLDSAARARVVDTTVSILNESYVFQEIAQKMAVALRAAQDRGQYKAIVDGETFAATLTDHLRHVSHDKHIEVRFSFVVQPPDEATAHPERDPMLRRQLTAINCGFEKTEHLPPNIGYLKFNMFADPEICAPTAIAALNSLADSDALIIDLRDNNGGHSGMVTLIASYLFAEPTHLNDAYDRSENSTREFWTSPEVPGKKFIGQPVFLLTSKATFSAAEDFSYALKNLNRATLIGETTGGGAHPIKPLRIDDHFSIIVPFARSISPITKTDWEGTGVQPNIRVPASDALREALLHARSN